MTAITRRRRGADAEEEAPSRGSRRAAREEDAGEEVKESPRRSRSNREESEDKPARKRSGSSGWGAYAAKRTTGSSYTDDFKPADHDGEEVPIKVLDKGPYEIYLQHWIDTPPKIRKSYCCLGTFEEECPLCEIGDSPSTVALLNILDLYESKKPSVKIWKMSVTVADQFVRLSESKRSSPLDREDLYFIVSPVKKGGSVRTTVAPIDADKLQEYYEIEPFDADELSEFDSDKQDTVDSAIKIDTRKELLDLIEEYDL